MVVMVTIRKAARADLVVRSDPPPPPPPRPPPMQRVALRVQADPLDPHEDQHRYQLRLVGWLVGWLY